MRNVATLAFRVARTFWWFWMVGFCCLAGVVVWLEFVAPEATGNPDPPRTLGDRLMMLGIVASLLGLGLVFRVLLRKAEARMVALGVLTRAGEDGTPRGTS